MTSEVGFFVITSMTGATTAGGQCSVIASGQHISFFKMEMI